MFENTIPGTPVQITYDLGFEDSIKDSVCIFLKREKDINTFFDGEDEDIFQFSDNFIKSKNMQLKFDDIDFEKLFEAINKLKKKGIKIQEEAVFSEEKFNKLIALKKGEPVILINPKYKEELPDGIFFFEKIDKNDRCVFFDCELDCYFAFSKDYAKDINMIIKFKEDIPNEKLEEAKKIYKSFIENTKKE